MHFLHSFFDDVIQMLVAMIEQDLYTPEQINSATAQALQDVIGAVDDRNLVAASIKSIAEELVKPAHAGRIPTTKEGLLGCNVDDSVASLLMQHVFGSTELLVGLDTRKLLVAVDLVDWEESGAKEKPEVKMAKITADRVRKSLATWLPKGDGRTFQDCIEDIGQVMGENSVGFWGKFTRLLNTNFSVKDKKELQDMAESVMAFYRATKSGGRRSRSTSC